MAKGGQGKDKAKGYSKVRSSYSPPSTITYPGVTKRTVRTSTPRISYGRGVDYKYTTDGKLVQSKHKSKQRRYDMTAYCMKCRKKVEMKNPKQVTMKNGRPATTGTCPYCGTKVFRIGK